MEIGPLLIQLWLLKMHAYKFLNKIHRSSYLCSLLHVEHLLIFEDVVHSTLNMCLYDCSLILTEPNTNQIQKQSDCENEPLKTHLHYKHGMEGRDIVHGIAYISQLSPGNEVACNNPTDLDQIEHRVKFKEAMGLLTRCPLQCPGRLLRHNRSNSQVFQFVETGFML